jgi:hypothetical protein
VTVLCDAVRALSLGNSAHPVLPDSTASYVWHAVIWAVGIMAVAVPLTVLRFNQRRGR